MKRFDVPIPKYPAPLGCSDRICSIGSCFAEHMAKRLSQHGLTVSRSPFDPLYHPVPIAELLERCLEKRQFKPAECRFDSRQQTWHLLSVHGRYHDSDVDRLCDRANSDLAQLRTDLLASTVLMCTLGTSEAYHLAAHEGPPIVGNCHRFPAQDFIKQRTPVTHLIQRWHALLQHLYKHIPDLRVILTVSPIRYGSADPHAHSCSKAGLHLLIDELKDQYPLWYFPAYEIWMDELRDYEHYADDGKHPSETAIDHAWQRFVTAAADRELRTRIRKE